ncbi:MAG: hypothetical protein EG826_14480 [Deltaproteobacteria bacterium]|nr:hypothetical protein [Deltaproteobacteria bacterium]
MNFKLTAFIAATLLLFFLTAPAEAKIIFQAGQDITIADGQNADNVIVIGGQITVNGLVEQNVVAIAGSVVLTKRAVVRGNVIVVGGVVARGSGSLVYGEVTEINSTTLSEAVTSAMRGELEGWSLILNIISLCFFAIILITTLIMTLLIPRSLALIANAIESNKLKSLIWGILATLMIVPFFMLLAISIIGIVLIPLAFTVLLIAAIVGFIAFGVLLGNFLITRIFRGYKKSLVKEALVGVSLLWLLGWIPFYIGMLIKALAITFGLGGVLITICRKRTSR